MKQKGKSTKRRKAKGKNNTKWFVFTFPGTDAPPQVKAYKDLQCQHRDIQEGDSRDILWVSEDLSEQTEVRSTCLKRASTKWRADLAVEKYIKNKASSQSLDPTAQPADSDDDTDLDDEDEESREDSEEDEPEEENDEEEKDEEEEVMVALSVDEPRGSRNNAPLNKNGDGSATRKRRTEDHSSKSPDRKITREYLKKNLQAAASHAFVEIGGVGRPSGAAALPLFPGGAGASHEKVDNKIKELSARTLPVKGERRRQLRLLEEEQTTETAAPAAPTLPVGPEGSGVPPEVTVATAGAVVPLGTQVLAVRRPRAGTAVVVKTFQQLGREFDKTERRIELVVKKIVEWEARKECFEEDCRRQRELLKREEQELLKEKEEAEKARDAKKAELSEALEKGNTKPDPGKKKHNEETESKKEQPLVKKKGNDDDDVDSEEEKKRKEKEIIEKKVQTKEAQVTAGGPVLKENGTTGVTTPCPQFTSNAVADGDNNKAKEAAKPIIVENEIATEAAKTDPPSMDSQLVVGLNNGQPLEQKKENDDAGAVSEEEKKKQEEMIEQNGQAKDDEGTGGGAPAVPLKENGSTSQSPQSSLETVADGDNRKAKEAAKPIIVPIEESTKTDIGREDDEMSKDGEENSDDQMTEKVIDEVATAAAKAGSPSMTEQLLQHTTSAINGTTPLTLPNGTPPVHQIPKDVLPAPVGLEGEHAAKV